MARLTDEQVIVLAILERECGAARLLAPGPRRDRMLRQAFTYGAVVVALSELTSCTCCCPFVVVEDDGRAIVINPT